MKEKCPFCKQICARNDDNIKCCNLNCFFRGFPVSLEDWDSLLKGAKLGRLPKKCDDCVLKVRSEFNEDYFCGAMTSLVYIPDINKLLDSCPMHEQYKNNPWN